MTVKWRDAKCVTLSTACDYMFKDKFGNITLGSKLEKSEIYLLLSQNKYVSEYYSSLEKRYQDLKKISPGIELLADDHLYLNKYLNNDNFFIFRQVNVDIDPSNLDNSSYYVCKDINNLMYIKYPGQTWSSMNNDKYKFISFPYSKIENINSILNNDQSVVIKDSKEQSKDISQEEVLTFEKSLSVVCNGGIVQRTDNFCNLFIQRLSYNDGELILSTRLRTQYSDDFDDTKLFECPKKEIGRLFKDSTWEIYKNPIKDNATDKIKEYVKMLKKEKLSNANSYNEFIDSLEELINSL